MYTIYTDKSEDFRCKIGVEGSEISKTKARLVIEGKNISLLFEGEIDSNGDCVIPINKVKNIFSESEVGKMKLEVISDDTFFSPWEDEFEVKTNKKVTVEVEDKSSKKIVKETKVEVNVVLPVKEEKELIPEKIKKLTPLPIDEASHSKNISLLLTENGITLLNMKDNKTKLNSLMKEYGLKNNINIYSDQLLDDIINNLKY